MFCANKKGENSFSDKAETMALTSGVWFERFDVMVFLLLLMITPVIKQASAAVTPIDADTDPAQFLPANNLTSSAVSCSDIHGDSFGSNDVKPGVCYLLSAESGIFVDARSFCQGLNDSLGWDVADIEDETENKLLQDTIDAKKAAGELSSASIFWIGQNDLKTENVWRYLNDSSNNCNSSVYLNWASGQPNGGLRQNCMAYFYEDGGNFQDRRCDDSFSYMCKVKITTDTVPTCPDFVDDTSTGAPDECLEVWPFAFSNPAVPGVCYVGENYQTFSFDSAQAFCGTLTGGSWSVMDIEHADENLFLEAWNRDNFPKNDGYWIGQNDQIQEGDWRYTASGQCPVYLNWESGQPNGAADQNCAVMFKSTEGQFQDKSCTEKYYTLCKLKKDPGPTQDPSMSCPSNTTQLAVNTTCGNVHPDAFGNDDVKPGVCYLLSEGKGIFFDARSFCHGLNDSLGWDVADIEDETENKLLQDAIAGKKAAGELSSASVFWIGQNDLKTENVWRYLNDSSNNCNSSVYLNWKSNQPNGGLRQNCMAYFYEDGGNFQDRRCDDQYYYLCKVKITTDTVPTCPDFVEDTSTEAPDECLDVLPDAFSNPSVPGICYVGENSDKFSFEEAISFCGTLGGGSWSVVDIEDADENLFLEAWNRDNYPNNNGYWLSQNDREQEDDWRYMTSGQCPVYLNWDTGQPNGAREQNCAVMFKSPEGEFQDKDCSERYYTLCKLRKDPGPTQNPSISCSNSTVPPHVAECASVHANAFGSADSPGACYFLTDQQLTWEKAVEYCQKHGWSLVDVENAVENEMLAARHRDFRPLDLYYWVGQNDREIEGTWKYLSNDTPSDGGVYLNWEPGQPGGGVSQNCIMMDQAGLWEDKECGNSYHVICKKRLEQDATTAAAWTDPCPAIQADFFGAESRPGVCYVMLNEQNTWEDSKTKCQGLGAGWNVPDIEDDNDLLALVTVNNRLFSANDGYWIGQNDQAVEGTWRYLDPEISGEVYERWDSSGSNQPDGGNTENCAIFLNSRDGKFQDVPCGDSYFTSCKNRNAYDVSAATTQSPTTEVAATTQSPTTEVAANPPLDPGFLNSTALTKSGHFMFLAADATCRPDTALPSYPASDRFQCARKCLRQGNCRSFSFVASGEEDACELCSEILKAGDLQFKASSAYYYEV